MTLPEEKSLMQLKLLVRAASHPMCRKILKYLSEHPGITVTEIYTKFRVEQSVASQFLAQLRRAGLVTTERDGKYIKYFVNGGSIEVLNDILSML